MAITCIAQQLSDEAIYELKVTFRLLDSDGDGSLTKAELSNGLENHNIKLPPMVGQLFKQIDTDGSGGIDYCEFIAAALDAKHYMDEAAMWSAFRTFDLDGDGSITHQELKELMKTLSHKNVTHLINSADLDGDGEISFTEWVTMLRRGGRTMGTDNSVWGQKQTDVSV